MAAVRSAMAREVDMRWSGVLIAAGLCLAASSVQADISWNGPGWYVVAVQDTTVLLSGPFVTQASCEYAKPEDSLSSGVRYACKLLERSPDE